MIRVLNSILILLLVVVALVGYGSKEETRALRAEIAELEATKTALTAEIRLLEAEWDHVTSPKALRETAARLYGDGAPRGVDGMPLVPWRAAQLLPLAPPPPLFEAGPPTAEPPSLAALDAAPNGADDVALGALETATIPDEAAEGSEP